MVLQVTELGLASCVVSRGSETFATPEGVHIAREWDVPESYECMCFVILGHRAGEAPRRKPRKPGRVLVAE